MNGILVDDFFRYSCDMLMAHNEDAELYESSFSQFGIKVKDINEKVKHLTCMQVCAILTRISEFWNNQNGTGEDFDKLAEW